MSFVNTYLLAMLPLLGGDSPTAVDFNRDIRPILSETCFACHGPDEQRREAELRLDVKESVFAERESGRLIVPGKPAASDLYRRISTKNIDARMPPPDSGKSLSPRQIELVKTWIEQGAKWQEHWSFVPPKRPSLPAVQKPSWPRNALDHFVLSRLEREGLAPSSEAAKETLIRRATLELTGLPPTLAEIDAFLADGNPDAYERLVDRLLASPRYGDRMAVTWLDFARYADTSGYQNDGPRHMWRWRDWVIDAFNAGMPFDEFTVQQLGGDLIPGATLAERIATGFNRNHRGNAEGGIIPEEYAVEYVVDRVDTTFTVWLGLTMGCARCHSHKYDPLQQKEFYQAYAFFNSIPEHGRAIKEGNSPPYVEAPTDADLRILRELRGEVASAERDWEKLQPSLPAAQARWEVQARSRDQGDGNLTDGLVASYRLDADTRNDQPVPPAAPARATDAVVTPAAPREPAPKHSDLRFGAGRLGLALDLDGSQWVEDDVAKFGYLDKFALAAWIKPNNESAGTILSRMTDAPEGDGYCVQLRNGKVEVLLVKRWLDDSIRVETEESISTAGWRHVLVSYDGSRKASGIKVYLDGKPAKTRVRLDYINQTFATTEPLRIGAGGGPGSRFRGRIDDVRIYSRDLSDVEASIVATPESIDEILDAAPANRTAAQSAKLSRFFVERHADQPVRLAWQRLTNARRRLRAFREAIPTVMVMQELPSPRPTAMLTRGEYDKPGESVSRGVPTSLPPMTDDLPKDRLGFAKWLIDPHHPLTARVAVNRIWELHFGTGLVKTSEDFGSQGERPSHPELLDYLATEFAGPLRWDIKALQRLVLTSATYRQASAVSPELLSRDPENRLLARGPRFRLSAQTVRDQALALSGLLVERLGGPSVKPYQPEGLWKEIATDTEYEQGTGADLYRRSLYTYWKRTVAPPSMVAFDASTRETCVVRPTRTNTPLQALALLNDVTYVEASQSLARRALRNGNTDSERLSFAFRLATSRQPVSQELEILQTSLNDHRDRYQASPDLAGQSLDKRELAAYSAIATVLLNLDEIVTKE